MNQRSRSRTAVAIAGAFLVPALLGGAALVLRSSGWIRSLEAQEVRRADAVVREIRDRWFQSLREGTSAEFVVDREASGAAGMPFARAPEPFVVDRERSPASDERSDPSTGALLRQLGLGYAEAGVEDLALSCFERAFAEVATSDAGDERAAALDSWTTDQLLACAESFATAGRLDEAELLRRFLCEARPGEWRDLLSVPMLASLRAVEWPGTTLEVEARRARIRDEFVAGGLPIDPRTVGVIAARTGLSGALRETLEAAGRAVRTEACSEFAIGSIEGLPDGSVVLTEADRFRFVGATLVQEILDAAIDSVREDLGLDALAVRVGDPRSDREEEAERVLARSTFPSLAIVATSVLPSDRIRSISLYLGLAALGSLVFGQVLVWYVVRREVALTRLKSDFVDLVSHELRTPLAALTIKTEMLAYGAVPEDKLVRYGLDIHRSALRLGALVEDVLDFARLEKGRVGPELRPQSVRALVAEGLRESLEALRAAGSSVRAAVPRDLPQVLVDRRLVVRAIRNLLDNAARHAPGRSVCLSAARDRDRSRAAIRLVVEDEGPGFGSGEPALLFEPFRRREAAGSSVRGSGLGLAIVREVARVHGGRIEASNRTDRSGARVTLWLPVARGSGGSE
jgi:signal transduction histidine kinase